MVAPKDEAGYTMNFGEGYDRISFDANYDSLWEISDGSEVYVDGEQVEDGDEVNLLGKTVEIFVPEGGYVTMELQEYGEDNYIQKETSGFIMAYESSTEPAY